MAHHSNGLVGIKVGVLLGRGEALQHELSRLITALTNKPPGRFGSEVDADEDGSGPEPLQSVWNAVSPLVRAERDALENTRSEELANDPAEVDVGGEDGT